MTMQHGSIQHWTFRQPEHDFQRYSEDMLVVPTYSENGGTQRQVWGSSGATTFTTPPMPDDDPDSAHIDIPGVDLCERCEEVEIENLFGIRNGQKHQLGWATNILACKCCALCRLLSAAVRLENGSDMACPADMETCFVILTSVPATLPLGQGPARHYHLLALFVDALTATVVAKCRLRLLGDDAPKFSKTPLFAGRLVDRQVANMDLACRWLSTCDESHDCYKNGSGSNDLQLLVVDVNRHCLVELPLHSRYVALSYVWPTFDPNTLQLKKDNLQELRTPGSIQELLSKLPRVIRDACQVVSMLKETFIWIDALCIVQDDPALKLKLIKQMDKVYGQAYVTLVAATAVDRSEDYAIPGIGTARLHQQFVGEIEGIRLVSALPDYNTSLASCRWSSRGWTFQEGALSPRCLILTDHQMYFRCTQDARCEDVIAEGETENLIAHPARPKFREGKIDYLLDSGFHRDTQSQGWFQEYARLVRDFTKRTLSFESDILKAFTGIMNHLSPHIEGTGFFCGQPFAKFVESLLWYPTGAAHRRVLSDFEAQSFQEALGIEEGKEVEIRKESERYQPGHRYYPSWSWAGWVGRVDFEANRFAASYNADSYRPVVQWYRWSNTGLVPMLDLWEDHPAPAADTDMAADLSLLREFAITHTRLIEKYPYCIMAWCSHIQMKFQLPEDHLSDWVMDVGQSLPCLVIQDALGHPCGFMPSVDRDWIKKYKEAGGGGCELILLALTAKSLTVELRQAARFVHTRYCGKEGCLPVFLYVMLVEYNEEGAAERRGVGLVHRDAVDAQADSDLKRKMIALI